MAASPYDIWNDFPLIDAAANRLQKVVVGTRTV